VLAHLFPHHPAAVLHPLQLDAARGHAGRARRCSAMSMRHSRLSWRPFFLIAYFIFALLPIYWMANMSLRTNEEILSQFSLWPQPFSWASYKTIFTDPSWYSGYINSLIYVCMN